MLSSRLLDLFHAVYVLGAGSGRFVVAFRERGASPLGRVLWRVLCVYLRLLDMTPMRLVVMLWVVTAALCKSGWQMCSGTWGCARAAGKCAVAFGECEAPPVILCSARCRSGRWFGCDLGDAVFGTGCVSVQEQLANGECIQASTGVFAAVLDDGPVGTWGDASPRVFAAIRDDGTVGTWGDASLCGIGRHFGDGLDDGPAGTWGDASLRVFAAMPFWMMALLGPGALLTSVAFAATLAM